MIISFKTILLLCVVFSMNACVIQSMATKHFQEESQVPAVSHLLAYSEYFSDLSPEAKVEECHRAKQVLKVENSIANRSHLALIISLDWRCGGVSQAIQLLETPKNISMDRTSLARFGRYQSILLDRVKVQINENQKLKEENELLMKKLAALKSIEQSINDRLGSKIDNAKQQ